MKKIIFALVASVFLSNAFFVAVPYARAQNATPTMSELVELLITLGVIPADKIATARTISGLSSVPSKAIIPTCTAWANKDTVVVDETFVVSWSSSASVRYATGKFGDKESANGSQTISSGVPGMYVYPIKVYDEKGNTGVCEARVLVTEKKNTAPLAPTVLNKNSLFVNVLGEGHIISQGSPRRISCGSLKKDCEATYATGTLVTLTVTKGPAPLWQGCESVSKNGYNCKLRVNTGSQSVQADFKKVSATNAPTCTLTTDKNSYVFGETVRLSWKSAGASYAAFQEDTSGKDYIKLPGDKLDTSGTHSLKANLKGNAPVTLKVYGAYGTGTCSVVIPTVSNEAKLQINPHHESEIGLTILKNEYVDKTLMSFTIDADESSDDVVLQKVPIYISLPYVKAGFWNDMIKHVLLVSDKMQDSILMSSDVQTNLEGGSINGFPTNRIKVVFDTSSNPKTFTIPRGVTRTYRVVAMFNPMSIVGGFGNSNEGYVEAEIGSIASNAIISDTWGRKGSTLYVKAENR